MHENTQVIFPQNKFPIKNDKMGQIKWYIQLYNFEGKTKYASYAVFLIKLLGLIGQTLYICHTFDDFETLVDIVATYPIPLLAVLKMFAMIIFKNRIQYFFKTVENDFWDVKIVNNKLGKRLNRRLKLINISLFLELLECQMFVVLLLIFPIAKIPKGKMRRLPALIYFPFDTDQSPIYEFLTIVLSWNLFVSVFGNCLYDFLFFYGSQHLCVQFILLKKLLRNLSTGLMDNANDIDKFKSKHFQNEVKKRFNICARHHSILLKYGNELIKYTYVIFGIQLLCSFTALVIAGFVLTESHQDMIKFTMLLSFLVATTIEMLLFAFQATELSKQSTSVAEAAAQSKWYLFNFKIKRDLAFLIMRAKDGIILSAAGLAEMNNQIIVLIYQKVFSCITLLQSLRE